MELASEPDSWFSSAWMSDPNPIVCRPTRWFLLRGAAMLVLFSVFAVLFYLDGSVGYRKKNQAFFVHRAFQTAATDFSQLNADGTLTPERWRTHAAAQKIHFPEDPSLLPSGLPQPMAWPEILQDFERMKRLQSNQLWVDYTGEQGMDHNVKEKPFSAREIGEQWVVFWISLTLALVALFFLVRTWRRSLVADVEALVAADGKRVPYRELSRLDLRKWDTKGIAFADYEGPSGKGRVRIDGLTYGGFRKEENQPAEQLMQRIRGNFSGEILEYEPVLAEDATAADPQPESSVEAKSHSSQ